MGMSNDTNITVNIDNLRNMVLYSIKKNYIRFKGRYGKFVIACDDKDSWRKEIFPYYKANRKKSRDTSSYDWKEIYQYMTDLREEIQENFSFPVIRIEKCEADDIIGELVRNFHVKEPMMILSADKDYKQLHVSDNVQQYDSIRTKFIECNNPKITLKSQIISGDASDGIPNVLSEDNCLVVGKRQKSIYQKKKEQWIYQKPEDFLDSDQIRYYNRNRSMIDLSLTPDNLKKNIMDKYHEETTKQVDRQKTFLYLSSKGMSSELQNFY
jgi:hypothetical protein